MRLLTHGGIFVLLLSTKAVGQLPPDPALKRAVDAREAALAVGDGETWGRLAQPTNTPYTTYDPWQDDVPDLQQALR